MKTIKRLLVLVVLLSATYLWVKHNNDSISKDASSLIYSDIQTIPAKDAALVLGTIKYLEGGLVNYFYSYRIDATVALYRAGKIKAVVVSGDNRREGYDEPTTMYDDLVARGIPSEFITLDYAGFRTLDSIIRAKAIFDLDDYIIVSQRFHLERAIYLAHANKHQVIGFVAKDFQNTVWAKKMEYRELLARAKAFLDVHILRTEPKFYGTKVVVNYNETSRS